LKSKGAIVGRLGVSVAAFGITPFELVGDEAEVALLRLEHLLVRRAAALVDRLGFGPASLRLVCFG
jgi:hypothetical protein